MCPEFPAPNFPPRPAGNLGHGQCTNVAGPRLVTRMSGKGVRAVAAGEGSTAAISADMRLYMWGTGRAGQLGNGYAFPVAEPAPVIFPGVREDTRVRSAVQTSRYLAAACNCDKALVGADAASASSHLPRAWQS